MWRIHTVEEVDQNPRYNSHFNGYGLGWGLSDEKVILKFHTRRFTRYAIYCRMYRIST
jgi:hypothetical protein